MARNAQQLARIALAVLSMTRGRVSLSAAIGLCVAAVLYVAVLQPVAERTLGISLPSIPTADGPSAPPAAPPTDERSTPNRVDPSDLKELLTDRGRGVYESPAGLRYTRGSQHGHRLAHVMAHARDEPDRVGQHGVFDETDPAALVRLLDDVYEQALAGRDTRTQREDGRTVYTVNLGRRVGYVGGQSGARKGNPPARHVKLVVDGDRLITAFPLRP